MNNDTTYIISCITLIISFIALIVAVVGIFCTSRTTKNSVKVQYLLNCWEKWVNFANEKNLQLYELKKQNIIPMMNILGNEFSTLCKNYDEVKRNPPQNSDGSFDLDASTKVLIKIENLFNDKLTKFADFLEL